MERQTRGEAETDLRVAAFQRPRERAPEVVYVGLEQRDPSTLLRALQFRARLDPQVLLRRCDDASGGRGPDLTLFGAGFVPCFRSVGSGSRLP